MPTWREWSTRVEWNEDVDPAIKERLGAFLDAAMAKLAILAACLTDATDMELVAALSGHLQQRKVVLVSDARETVRAIHKWAMGTADEMEVGIWAMEIAWTLEDDSAAMQFVTMAVLLERICRALAADRPDLDTERDLSAAADRLEQHTRWVLSDVLTGRIRPVLIG